MIVRFAEQCVFEKLCDRHRQISVTYFFGKWDNRKVQCNPDLKIFKNILTNPLNTFRKRNSILYLLLVLLFRIMIQNEKTSYMNVETCFSYGVRPYRNRLPPQ